MLRRRHLLRASAGLLAAPAIVRNVGAARAFDWQQAWGSKLEVNLAKGPNADVLQAHQKEFEAMTGIRVGSEQIPEQQQRTKTTMELASGHPTFDVMAISLHVQKRMVEKAQWMVDLRQYIGNPSLTGADFDFADFGSAAVAFGTAFDGSLHTIPTNQDFWMVYWNKALFAEKNLPFPKTMDEMYETAKQLTDPSRGIYGFVGRGQKNANVPLYTSFQLGQDQDTVTADGKTLLMDTPEAIWAGEMYKKIMRETAPPGAINFNWNECQTSFSQGKIGMWIDGIGFSAPLIDPTKSKVAKQIGFTPIPKGPKSQYSGEFVSGFCIPTASKNRVAAWLYVQWASGKTMSAEVLRLGSGTPPRASSFRDPAVLKSSPFPQEWFDCSLACQKIARPGLPIIVSVTEFRDVYGVALTNMISGADVATELKRATKEFKPILAREFA